MFKDIKEVPKKKLANIISACANSLSVSTDSTVTFVGSMESTIPHLSNECEITHGAPKKVDILVFVGNGTCNNEIMDLVSKAKVVIVESIDRSVSLRRTNRGNVNLTLMNRSQFTVAGGPGENDYIVYGDNELVHSLRDLGVGELDQPIYFIDESKSLPQEQETEDE